VKRLLKVLGVLAAILIVAFLLLRTPDTDPAAMRAKYGTPPSQFVALANGLTVHLRDEGPRDAPAIVLLHGSNADLLTWQAWTESLRGKYRVIRFDQRGHGLTGAAPDGDYSPERFTDDVGAVADKLGVRRFVLAGNSMGGGIAARYAMAHPERVRALVLVDAGGAPQTAPAKGNIGFKLAATPGVNLLMRSITPRFLIERSLRQTVANQGGVTPAMVDRYWELLRYPGNRAATAARFAQPRKAFTPAQLGALHMPVLILWGAHDRLIPVAGADWFQRAIPGSEKVVFADAGHIPMEELPGPSVKALTDWLAKVDAAKPAS